MSSLDYFNIIDELRQLSSYLEFGQKNLEDFRQRLVTKLNKSTDELRELEGIHPDVSNDEIIRQVEEQVDAMSFLNEFPVIENGKNPVLHISNNLEWLKDADYYDNTFYASVVILVYSCIERGLIKYFDLVDSKNSQGVLPQVREILDNQNSDRIKSEVWKELKFIRWLRNTITHSGMSFSLDDSLGDIVYESWGKDALVNAQPDLIKYLKSNNIYIKEYGVISLNLDYCKYVIKFANNLFSQIDSRM